MVSSFWYRLSTAIWMNTNPSIRKNNEDQPDKYGNQLKMANPFYDSITARCFHIWITITAKDRHPWITAEVCHPRIMASCFRKLNLTTVCKLQSDHGRGLSPSDYCLLHLQLESDNRLHFAIGWRRIATAIRTPESFFPRCTSQQNYNIMASEKMEEISGCFEWA